ncbi:uncharacterized protein LOC115796115 [Archocentrus centrarchus]|uniref:uncharacterized protein LOC115796115 n=1 Tax=Archocentrus centrarchus TaxID=63155 RepID=UPI0011EA4F18|nr:uncharacterized protein LOC115796115 [Archocentrus centrarchus]
MDRILFWGVLLLYSFEIQGLQHVFVLYGKDLHLDVKKPVVLDKKTDLFWKFNSSNNVAKCSFNNDPVVFDKYEGRAELFRQNYTLLLKNVKHNDSGDYTAVVVGEQDQTVAEYKVKVQDPVSPVILTVTNSSDSCNITVTCSTVDPYISNIFRCNAKNCTQAEEKSLNTKNDHSSITVYLHEDFIICNHSNKVSWEQSKEHRPHCETNTVSSGVFIIAALAVVGVIVIVLCIVKKRKRGNKENTTCEAPQDVPPGQTQNQNVSADVCPSPTSTYALVEFHRGPELTKTKKNSQPETIYAQVNRAAQPRSPAPQPTPRAGDQSTESVYRNKHT